MLSFFIFISLIALAFILLLIIPLLLARFLFSFILLIIVIPLLALVAYWYLGASALIQEFKQQRQQNIEVQSKLAEWNNSPQKVIDALKQSLKANPDKAQAWYLLGKIYLAQANYAEAAASLAEANRLKPDEPEIMLVYAESLFLLNQERLSPQITQLLTAVLQKEPTNLDALNLFAIGAYNAGEYKLAIHYWREILNLLPADGPDQKAIINMIDKARQQQPKEATRHEQQGWLKGTAG